ncbi:pectinesterase inhibitor-like [Castanea sativa]|uniref:pectinesterase inhibitor-like n=1 Tax=Castanea sativa TaxID=21020 RepID=UPI003F64D2B7
MAPSFCASLFLSLMLAVLLICPTNAWLSMKVSENMLISVCSWHENPPFCLQTLQSDHHTPLVDLVGLINISIHLTDVAAKRTMALIRSLVNKTTDPILKAPFEVCLELYNSILGDLKYAKTALTTRDYSVKVASDSCMIDTENCKDELTSSAPPILQEKIIEMRYTCETQIIVSRHLP